ncbi:L-fucose:H+ symporter permease [Botrimarina sp.]|uniref:L-fucose:H+ symporter permease n=1 Tax=Botrimarina sp. TaxID=2795802 RepID=UPI0032EEB831
MIEPDADSLTPDDPPAQGAGGRAKLLPSGRLWPFILVTLLFPLWGFANDVTNPLVKAFQEIFLIKTWQASLVQFAFYGGYATMAIPAALAIRKISFKAGILIGLGLYAVGALLFIPASYSMQFWLFLVSLYVLTFGLAFLETSANPYILAMGPKETATRRLNLSQAFNPAGSLIGMIVSSQLVLPFLAVSEFRAAEKDAHPEYASMLPAEIDEAITEELKEYAAENPSEHRQMQSHDLAVIRGPYVVIALVVIALAVVFAVTKMPDPAQNEAPIHLTEVLRNLSSFRYVGGVVAQGVYVGAQICCWTFIIHYGVTLLGLSAAEAQNYNICAMVLFLCSRFVWTAALGRVSASLLLALLACGGVLFTAGAIFLPGYYGLYSLIAISCCMAVMFPTIYGIALDGLTVEDAKLGSAGLIFAIVGGALMPPLQGYLIDQGDIQFMGRTLESVRYSFVLPLGCFVMVAIYGAAVHATRGRREAV